jgi:hypothetical protein
VTDSPDLAAIQAEMDLARQARLSGNEGQARVRARRAAGWAVGVNAQRQGIDPGTTNAYLLLEWLGGGPSVPAHVREAARRLTVHITQDHHLPHMQDPLQDAESIIVACLPEAAPQVGDTRNG